MGITIFKNELAYPEYAEVNTSLLTDIPEFAKELGLVTGRYAIRVYEYDKTPWLHLDFSLPGGEGDNCVLKKQYTLDNHQDIYYTGFLDEDKLSPGDVKWFGAESIPFTEYVTDEETGKVSIHSGRVQTIFSGAKEVTDCHVSVFGFSVYKRTIERVAKNISFTYDYSGLRHHEYLRVPLALYLGSKEIA